jgi:hypothetical protein
MVAIEPKRLPTRINWGKALQKLAEEDQPSAYMDENTVRQSFRYGELHL